MHSTINDLIARGQIKKAIKAWKSSTRRQVASTAANENLGGQLYLRNGQPALAAKHFKRAVQQDPTLIPAWIGRAQVAQQANQFKQESAFLSHAIELDDQRITTLIAHARAIFRCGQIADALAMLENAADVHQDNRSSQIAVWQALGELKELHGDWSSAVKTWKRIGEKLPEDPAVAHRLANALRETSDSAQGAEILKTLVARFPANSDYRFDLVACLEECNRIDQASRFLDSRPLALKSPLFDLMEARLARRAGDLNSARLKLEKIAATVPEGFRARYAYEAVQTYDQLGLTEPAWNAISELGRLRIVQAKANKGTRGWLNQYTQHGSARLTRSP